MNRIVQVKDIAELNRETYKKFDFPTDIKYLDTSSLIKNKVEHFQFLNIHNDVIPSRAQRKIKENTILYSTVRPNQEHYGIIEKILENVVVSTGFTTLDVIDNEINPKFLFYLLTQPHITEYLHTIATNSVSAYPSISPNYLGNLKFRVPELETQHKIASVLSALDAKIELNNLINAELEAMAKTLYDYWFVQFDFPDKNGKPYKTSGGKMVWNEELKREIPEGWEVEILNNNISCILDHRGKTPLKLGGDWVNKGEGVIALSAKHVKDGKLVKLEDANIFGYDMYERWMPEKLKEGDILMTSEAPLGEFYFILNDTNYCMSQRLFAIRADFSKVLSTYLYFELSKGNGFSQIIGKASGSTVFGIRQDELRKVKILKPDLVLQILFEEKAKPMLLQIRNNEFQNQKLTQLRDWLLPMLMNGQVKVN
jgi:type I restriction enzyme S subunit